MSKKVLLYLPINVEALAAPAVRFIVPLDGTGVSTLAHIEAAAPWEVPGLANANIPSSTLL
jgi:hypothetical protein